MSVVDCGLCQDDRCGTEENKVCYLPIETQLAEIKTRAKAEMARIFKENNWSGGFYDLMRVLDSYEQGVKEVINNESNRPA